MGIYYHDFIYHMLIFLQQNIFFVDLLTGRQIVEK